MRTELTLRAFDLGLEPPLETSEGTIGRRRGLAIRLRTADGIGFGEATPLGGWTESFEACRVALREAGDRVADREAWQIRLPEPADRPAARHGLQLAVMDLAARSGRCSLAEYLGGPRYDREVPVNATIGDADIDGTVAAAERAVAAGFRSIKCKVGVRSVTEDVERILAVREAIGPEPAIRVDANRAWSVPDARRAMEGFARAGVSLAEEPLETPTPAALERLPSTPGIGLDETLLEAAGVDRWVDRIDAVVLKPMALGGIDRAVAVAETARRRALEIVVSTTIDAVIARTAAVHLAAALPDDTPAGLATADRLTSELADDPAPVRGGRITVPDGPGIGTFGPWDRSARRSTPHDPGP